MKAFPYLVILLFFQLVSPAQTIDVGSGAPDEGIRARFVQAYYRGRFSAMVSLPPVGQVGKFGTTGLRQEFEDAAQTSGVRLALIKANVATGPVEGQPDVLQVWALMYAYYNGLGVSTIGYPTMDTAACPVAAGSCTWQTFDKSYALFAYSAPIANGQNFSVKDPYYSTWSKAGGINVFGPATSAETAYTSTSGNATIQYFANGAIFNNTSGALNGRVITVKQPVYDLYIAKGGPGGTLGLPTAEEILLANDRRRQTFQGGAIEYDPNSPPSVRLPVATVTVAGAVSPVRMNLNDTLALEATLRAADGTLLTDRVVVWSTSNSRVVSIESSGYKATVRATGGGTANVVASSEGKAALAITISVTAPCCQIGEGAPTGTIAQAFLDAVTRNRLNLKLPGPSPVRRVGNGFVQETTDAATGARILLAMSDRSPVAFPVSGAILARYEELGGPGGALGHPLSDQTSQGRQTFENGALAGSPVRVVAGAVLAKWATLNYEAGVLGPPLAEATAFFSPASTTGTGQAFRGGTIYVLQTGPTAGRALYTSGLIQAKHLALGGAAGRFGAPLNDEFGLAGRRRQDFEGGSIEYAPGDSEATANAAPRKPTVSATPPAVVAGGRIRIFIGGFKENATLNVSVSGQPDFTVNTPNGAFTWEIVAPRNAASGTVTVRAVDAQTGEAAEVVYSIRVAADARVRLSKAAGDEQQGAPGALLPAPLRVVLQDEFGNALAGVAVRFTASPGAVVSSGQVLTNAAGEAETYLRLPPAEGVALATAEAVRQVVTFAARAMPVTISGVPKFTSASDPLLAAAAAVVRYHQNRGELPATGGSADPTTLDAFLKSYCSTDPFGQQVCDGYLAAQTSAGQTVQVVNLWRVGAMAGGNLDVRVEDKSLDGLRTTLMQGFPVIVMLALETGAGHAVVATGVAGDGSIVIQDPNPAAPRRTLDDYLNASNIGGVPIRGSIAGAVRLLLRAPLAGGFLIHSQGASITLASAAGTCGLALAMPVTGGSPLEFVMCDGTQAVYQLDLTAAAAFKGALTDLGSPVGVVEFAGRTSGSFRVARPSTQWTLAPMDVAVAASSIVNGASFGPGLAPGALISIFGSGLARAGGRTVVEVGGTAAPVLAATPFQVNAQLPLELAAGTHMLAVRSPFGAGEASIQVQEVAPALFQLEAGYGAVVNQDGTVNGMANPAWRGQVLLAFGTGFGAVAEEGGLARVTRGVTAYLGNVEAPVQFAGLAPGFVGLYQLNLLIPRDMPPGLGTMLSARQGGVASNRVAVAIQ